MRSKTLLVTGDFYTVTIRVDLIVRLKSIKVRVVAKKEKKNHKPNQFANTYRLLKCPSMLQSPFHSFKIVEVQVQEKHLFLR